MDEMLPCGHDEAEHAAYGELNELIEHLTESIKRPRMSLMLTEDGVVHCASTVPAGEVISILQQTIEHLRRNGGNYTRHRADRHRSAQWN